MPKKKQAAPPPEPDLLKEPPVPADDMAIIIKAVWECGRRKGYEEGYAAGKAASTTITYKPCDHACPCHVGYLPLPKAPATSKCPNCGQWVTGMHACWVYKPWNITYTSGSSIDCDPGFSPGCTIT